MKKIEEILNIKLNEKEKRDWSKACFNYYGGCNYCPLGRGCKDAFKSIRELKEILLSKNEK